MRHNLRSVNTKRIFVTMALVIGLSMLPAANTLAGGQSSTNFSIPNDTISMGGGERTSTSFRVLDTVGQTSVIGVSESTNFTLYSGFWGPVEPAEPTPTPTPTVPPCLNNGDASGDGLLSAGDAQTAFYMALGAIQPTPEELCRADCNADGIISAGDAQAIFYAALGAGSCADPL